MVQRALRRVFSPGSPAPAGAPDAVVIGAGPNGLVAANMLCDRGWKVEIVEAQAEPGGAVRSAALTLPGYRHDLFSGSYPLAAVSPALLGLDLGTYGLRWRHAPLVLVHVDDDGRGAVLSRDPAETATSLASFASGDGQAWSRLYGLWQRAGPPLLPVLLGPFPPVRAGPALLARAGWRDGLALARLGLLPVRQLAEETFAGAGAPLLLAGNALHTDLGPDSAGSGLFGWLLTSLGQQVGFPVPEGGSERLTAALVARFTTRGGRVHCRARVTRIVVSGGRAVAVALEGGDEIPVGKAVIAAVSAPSLFLDLIGAEHLPAAFRPSLRRFHWDHATVKVDWALSGPIPWRSAAARRAGVIHAGGDLDTLSLTSGQLSAGRIPTRPFLVIGQPSKADPTRCPPGHETVWAYTHVPQDIRGDPAGGLSGHWRPGEGDRFADRLEGEIEQLAPGFCSLILGRHVLTPPDLEALDANLVGGAVNGGTARLHQQLLFRTGGRLSSAVTPVPNVYLASASAHPGGGVHGVAGANAARAAYRRAYLGGW